MQFSIVECNVLSLKLFENAIPRKTILLEFSNALSKFFTFSYEIRVSIVLNKETS